MKSRSSNLKMRTSRVHALRKASVVGLVAISLLSTRSVRAETPYQVGVFYQAPQVPKYIPGIAVTLSDGTVTYPGSYNQDDGWAASESYSFVNQWGQLDYFYNYGDSSYGFMDWLYTFVNNYYGMGGTCLDSNCYLEWTNPAQTTARVNRLYPERQPLLDGPGQPGKWFEYFNAADETKQVNAMKNSGVDFSAFLVGWEMIYCDTYGSNQLQNDGTEAVVHLDTTNGCPAEEDPLDYFLVENHHRSPDQQVLAAVTYEDAYEMAPGNDWLSTHTGADYEALFLARMQYYIDRYFRYVDASGNNLYLYRDGKPVVFIWDPGTIMMRLATQTNPVTFSTLLQDANTLAIQNGLQGIYWVDAASTTVKPCYYDGNNVCMSGPNWTGYANSSYQVADYETYQDVSAQAGFNAQVGWMYHAIGTNSIGYGQMTNNYSTLWSSLIGHAQAYHAGYQYFVGTTPGWDSRPVGEGGPGDGHDMSRSCDGAFDSGFNVPPTPHGCSNDGALFSTMLQNAKTAVDGNPTTTGQLVMVTTWNDVGEGHYMEPTVGDQGAHAEALAKTFREVPVYRFRYPSSNLHFYTLSKQEGLNARLTYEGVAFNVYPDNSVATVPIYRCLSGANGHYISTASNCEGAGNDEGLFGYIFPTSAGAVGTASPLYRLYNSRTGDHLETDDPNEMYSADSSGYHYEMILGYLYR